ncbi:MAG: hypothetical protein ACK5MI_06720 [Mangrovibacterium sp.]
MKKLIIFSLMLWGAFSLTNCADLDPLPWTQNDAFINTKYAADSTLVHGLSLYSRSNKRLSSSTAVSPDSSEYEMNVYVASQPFEFVWDTPDEDMASTVPKTGTYNFSAFTKSDNEEVTGTDILRKNYILPTHVASCAFDSVNSKLNIVWRSVDDADYAVIFLINANGKEVYASNTINANDTTESISESSSNWLSPDQVGNEAYVPSNGEKFTLQISNFKKDVNDSEEKLLDARSITTYDFTWQSPIETEE